MKNIHKLMKSIIRLTIILLVLSVFGKELKAQNNTRTNADTALLNPSVDIEDMLPPLDSLFVIALNNNPLQRLEQSQANAAYWNIKYVKVLWTQGLGVFFNYNFGNLPFFSGQIVANNGGTEFVSQYQGYRAGINISLTVFDFIGRRPRIKQAEELWEVTKHKKDVEALIVKQTLTDFYTNMIGWQKLWKARNEDMILQLVAVGVAEKEYKQGSIQMNEFARQRNVYSIAVAADEEAKKNYINFYERLQTTIGVKLSTLKRK